jgi:ribokinase
MGLMPRIAVVGSANMDLVVRAPRFPAAGETLLGGEFATHAGGKGANGAVAAGRVGASVSFVGMLGRDAFGEALCQSLSASGVDLTYTLRADATPTGIAQITVDDSGRNTIVVAPGANALLSPEDVTAALETIQPAVALASLEVPLNAVAACAGKAGFLIVNPAPAAQLPQELFPMIDLFTPNQTETHYYTGIAPTDDASCLEAAGKLFDQGLRRVVITLGDRGCFLATPELGRHIPNLEVKAVDTTGAGDAFNGALAAFLAEGRNMENALALANCVGALTCTRAGAQDSMPTLAELREVAGELL